jgi:hypothetical protein
MAYRKLLNTLTWHWCHNCSSWPRVDFKQREDKPPTWNGEALCEECARHDSCSRCQHAFFAGENNDAASDTAAIR